MAGSVITAGMVEFEDVLRTEVLLGDCQCLCCVSTLIGVRGDGRYEIVVGHTLNPSLKSVGALLYQTTKVVGHYVIKPLTG